MVSRNSKSSPNGALPFQTGNKLKRQELFIKHKKAKESLKREERFRRKKEEDKDPRLRLERRKRNVPSTIDRKRTWDDFDSDNEDGLGRSVDVERIKKQKPEDVEEDRVHGVDDTVALKDQLSGEDDERDSMVDSSTDIEEDGAEEQETSRTKPPTLTDRATSPTRSTTSTNLSLMPEALAAKFPTLFTQEPRVPKVLKVTTSLNSTLHYEAELLTTLFPNSVYIPRSAHRYGHKYSVREISKFAANRDYTSVIILNEDQKKPHGLDFVHLPDGPMFHFSITNWIEGKKLPGHGRPTNHYPELILNNFRTPLGLLTAHMFRSMFPPLPEFEGRQCVTMHNQRDFIFVRRHRYVFRDKRPTEKILQGPDGKGIKGVEGIRAGLQELGPRFTMKLRRIDKGIQRSSGQEWEWKGKTDR
ncbi:MAG: hypothetical protein LQ340_005433, partial [Diploschistes diacapsis]